MPSIHLDSGKRIYYKLHGPEEGRPVMLLHGWCATGRLWSHQVKALVEQGYRVIVIDSAGHGRSSKKDVDVSMDTMAATVYELVCKLGYGHTKIALAGHSAGGAMAMATYFLHPWIVDCLILLNTGYKMCDTKLREFVWKNAPPFVELAFSAPAKLISRPMVILMAEMAALFYDTDYAEARRWFTDIVRTRGNVARMEIEEITSHDIHFLLKRIKVPTLVIGGKYDLLAPERQSRIMGELIPDCQMHILPINHMGKMFNSNLINPLMIEFLENRYPNQ